MRLDNGKELSSAALGRLRHIDHGYASTSHSAQGATVDRVIVDIVVNRKQFYVSVGAQRALRRRPRSAWARRESKPVKNRSRLTTARREGAVLVKRRDGQMFLIQPERPRRSPLDVQGVGAGFSIEEFSIEEVVEIVREMRKRAKLPRPTKVSARKRTPKSR